MKKILFCLILLLSFNIVKGSELAKSSETAVLIEASTKKVLYEKDKDKKMYPASMTKMMTLLIAFECLDNGRINLTDEVNISKNASGMGGTQIYIEEGTTVKVQELLKGIAIASANDAAVAIAEHISGTEDEFVKLMNNKCKQLGCENTSFKNPHGLDEDGHYTTSYDMAIIASELVKYDNAIKLSSTYDEYININGEKHWLVNTNKLVRFYKGIDGLKTGYTDKAGYCLTSTMKKNNMRLISVVMNSKTKDERSSDTISMLEYGFSNYGSEVIEDKENFSGFINIKKSKERDYKYKLSDDVKIIVDKNIKNVDYKTEIKLNEVTAPLSKNSIVGKYILRYDNKVYNYDLLLVEDAEKSNFVNVFLNNLKDIITGNIRR